MAKILDEIFDLADDLVRENLIWHDPNTPDLKWQYIEDEYPSLAIKYLEYDGWDWSEVMMGNPSLAFLIAIKGTPCKDDITEFFNQTKKSLVDYYRQKMNELIKERFDFIVGNKLEEPE
jgi:hypothetical protein